MCGILLCISDNYQKKSQFDESAFNRRGPDMSLRMELCMEGVKYTALCSVLSLQRTHINSNFCEFGDYVLLWDGEIGGYDGSDCNLKHLIGEINACDGSDGVIIKICSQLCGAFAFILVQKSHNRIFFGRDRFGQHSLVYNSDLTHLGSLCFSNADFFAEVPASGIYLASAKSYGGFQIDVCYFWSESHKQFWLDHNFNKAPRNEVIANYPHLNGDLSIPVDTLRSFLQEAIARRLNAISHLSIEQSDVCTYSRAQIGVFFSGGLDSTVVAALADRCIPTDHPIDLINVAFQHLRSKEPRKWKLSDCVESVSEQTYASPDVAPDRQTALSSFEDLRRLNPDRHWHLLLVDVSIEELKNARRDRIRGLLRPAPETVLNDSLSIALWFAAQGRGRLVCSQDSSIESQRIEYTSAARVILTGTGADEQLAGYSRHRTIFMRQGAKAVEAELSMEMLRISERNLGRDDRIVSDHGRQAFHPFLDEKVAQYLASLPLEAKADLTMPRGEGEKRLLREVAASLDLHVASHLPKRAFQFGSRVAKTESLQKVLGMDSNLLNAG